MQRTPGNKARVVQLRVNDDGARVLFRLLFESCEKNEESSGLNGRGQLFSKTRTRKRYAHHPMDADTHERANVIWDFPFFGFPLLIITKKVDLKKIIAGTKLRWCDNLDVCQPADDTTSISSESFFSLDSFFLLAKPSIIIFLGYLSLAVAVLLEHLNLTSHFSFSTFAQFTHPKPKQP